MLKFLCSFFTIVVVACLLLSCDNAPEPNTRLEFATGNNLTLGNRTVTAGEIISTSLYARTASAAIKFKKFVITCNYDSSATNTVTYLDSALNVSDFGLYFTFGTRGLAGTETWQFTITDDRDSTYTKSFTLRTTTENAKQPFYTFSSLFYKQSGFRNLQYFSTRDGIVYPGYVALNDQAAIKPKIDFYFEIDDPNQNTFSLRTGPVNNTLFKTTTLTPTQFTQITNVTALRETYNLNTTPETTLISKSKADDPQVIAFKTAANKIGLLRLDTLQVLTDKINNTKYYRMPYGVKVESKP